MLICVIYLAWRMENSPFVTFFVAKDELSHTR